MISLVMVVISVYLIICLAVATICYPLFNDIMKMSLAVCSYYVELFNIDRQPYTFIVLLFMFLKFPLIVIKARRIIETYEKEKGGV